MSDTVEQPIASDAPAPEPVAAEPVVEQPVIAAGPADPEAEFDAAVEASAIDVPDGDRLVPLSAVTKLREKLRTVKQQQAAPDPALVQQRDEAIARLKEAEPLAHAFRAIQTAQQQQPQQQPQPQAPVEDAAELEDVAKLFDFYKPDGTPDLDRARKAQAMTDRIANKRAEESVRPWAQQSIEQRAQMNVARAKATTLPNSQDGADPQVLDMIVERLKSQPGGWQTLADPEAMKHVWVAAYGHTQAMRNIGILKTPQKAAPAPEAPVATAPVVTERSGGGSNAQPKTLSASEKRAAKDAGLTEKAYLDIAQGMKW